MFYLCLSFSSLWLVTFIYMLFLDRRIRDMSKKLKIREPKRP
ncbi:MAG: CcmD family protein [Phycisphaerales bacterium]|nr:MAG: CcmD family protein [Phycisphaerales bacterium]